MPSSPNMVKDIIVKVKKWFAKQSSSYTTTPHKSFLFFFYGCISNMKKCGIFSGLNLTEMFMFLKSYLVLYLTDK